MPEGHSVHRIARQFAKNFVGHRVSASSPQGRFAAGAALIDGRTMVEAKAVGKQMFLRFDDGRWLRVHLGMYGAWDFAGDISTDATIRSASGRMGQTNQRGTDPDDAAGTDLGGADPDDAAGEDSVASIGAPRRARFRMAESESAGAEYETWPPEPVGQVRVRLLTDTALADLRGPTACEVLDPAQVEAVLAKLGPDPLVDDVDEGERRFVETAGRKPTPIGLLLMDQSVVSGIGNVYRAEMLFRARLDPHTPGKAVPTDVLRALWRDWVHLLDVGVRTGQMLTIDDQSAADRAKAMASRADRHWVYKREGLPCRVCGTHIVLEEMGARKLYWCPKDQV